MEHLTCFKCEKCGRKAIRVFIIGIILVLLILTFVNCGFSEVEKQENSTRSSFVIIEETQSWLVVYHRKTKVIYTVSRGTYNNGHFMLLVDKDGKPLLWEGEENEDT